MNTNDRSFLPFWFRLAYREIYYNRKFFYFFCMSLSLGLLSFTILSSLKTSFSDYFTSRSKQILDADIKVSSSRPISNEELNLINSYIPKGSLLRKENVLYSMVRGKSSARLMQLQAVDKNFPLYGEIRLQKSGRVTQQQISKLMGTQNIWVYPELLQQLNVEIGDSIFYR